MRFYDAADIRAAQEHFGFLRPAPIEKDWHVVRALAVVSAMDSAPFKSIFAGGTALARAHRLVRRMSEDVDLKIVLADPEPISGSRLRRALSDLRVTVTEGLQTAGFAFYPNDRSQHRSQNENRYTVYHLPYDDQDVSGHGLRPAIQIELTYATLRRPPVALPVSSFLAEAFGQPPELATIDCVSVTETAAEKFVGLTRRIAMELAGVSRDPDPTMVRHIYDLHLIRDDIAPDDVADLARDIALMDAAEHKNQYPAYYADIDGETRKALAAIENDPFYRGQYKNFVESMVYGEKPEFEKAFVTVKELATRFLGDRRANFSSES